MNHSQLKERALQKNEVREEFEKLAPEFQLLREMLRARRDAGLSQADIAKRMGTKPPAITRLESSLSSGRHSPSIATLKKYAEAVDCHLEIRLVH